MIHEYILEVGNLPKKETSNWQQDGFSVKCNAGAPADNKSIINAGSCINDRIMHYRGYCLTMAFNWRSPSTLSDSISPRLTHPWTGPKLNTLIHTMRYCNKKITR